MRRAFAAFRRSAVYALDTKPYRQGALAPPQEKYAAAFGAARDIDPEGLGHDAARLFFENWFRPFDVLADGPDTDPLSGKVTAFYEPIIQAGRTSSARYRYPFLRKPAQLCKIEDPDNPPNGIEPGFAFAVDAGNDSRETCPDRRAIENGAFDGLGLEIAWVEDKADAFFAHVQGSARLDFGSGEVARITYAAKSGHPFTGIGRLLVARGEIPASEISMQSIRRWLQDHPLQSDELIWENQSYIFFDEVPVPDHNLGPVAAAKVPLEPGRSMAVDRLLHSFGTPFFVHAPQLKDFDDDKPFARLMIAQDTGSAIVGSARGDLFTGSGDYAGELAGAVNAVARFTVLLPR